MNTVGHIYCKSLLKNKENSAKKTKTFRFLTFLFLIFIRCNQTDLNPFHASGLLLQHLKTTENQRSNTSS